MGWLGNKLNRGVICLSLGLVELTMQRYGKGAAHLGQGWWLLRGVEDEVHAFRGPERIELFSIMQCVCGTIESAAASLPSGLLRAAKFVGGKGDVKHANDLIWHCYNEDGIMAPVAALS